LNGPALERKGWQQELAPAFIGLFFWIAFFDQIPRETLALAGVAWGVMGAALGSVLAYQFLYYVPSMWGTRTGKPLAVIATSTFGVSGATYVPGLILTLVQVVWLAVATSYASRLCLDALVLFRLLGPGALRSVPFGRWTAPSPLFMTTVLFWGLASAMVGRYFVRVISALMKVYPVVPAFLLGLGMVFAFRGLPAFQPPEPSAGLETPAQLSAMLVVAQMIFGFFASSALLAVDWGAVTRGPGDVKAGGWVGVMMASWVAATLAILTVAGSPAQRLATSSAPSYHEALPALVNPRFAGLLDLAFGMSSLAPACYAGYLFGRRMYDWQPRVSETMWTIVGVAGAWGLVVVLGTVRMLDVFSISGAVLAPAVGAMAADYVRARGRWPGPRSGVNLAGLSAWLIGVVVGLLPYLAGVLPLGRLGRLQPAAVFAFLAAFVVYYLAATLGLEPALDPVAERAIGKVEA
jgi:cytosine permease